MNINFTTHNIESESETKNMTIGIFLKTRDQIQGCICTIKRRLIEIDAKRQDRQNKQQQVYRYSIGRMNSIKKLQMGLYRN